MAQIKDKHRRLSIKKERAIIALLENPTIQAAADAAGVGRRTLTRWLNDLDFRRAYLMARREVMDQVIGRLQKSSWEMADVLTAIAVNPESPTPSRVAAAKAVLDMAFKGIELNDLLLKTRRYGESFGL